MARVYDIGCAVFRKILFLATFSLTLTPMALAQQSPVTQTEDSQVQSGPSSAPIEQLPPFKLQTKHMDTLQPASTTPVLQGSVKGNQLDSNASNSVLRGGTKEDASPINTVQHKRGLQSGTDFTGLPAQLDGSLVRSKRLQGGVDRATLPPDVQLDRRKPQIEPDLNRAGLRLPAEIERTRVPLQGAVDHATLPPDVQLDRRKPQIEPDLNRAGLRLPAEIEQTRVPLQGAVDHATLQPDVQLDRRKPQVEPDLSRVEVNLPLETDRLKVPLQGAMIRATPKAEIDYVGVPTREITTTSTPQAIPVSSENIETKAVRSKPQTDVDLTRVQTSRVELERTKQQIGIQPPESLPIVPRVSPVLVDRDREHTDAQLERVKRQVGSELVPAKQQIVPDDMAQAGRLKPQTATDLTRARTEVHAIFRRPEMTPELVTGARIASSDNGSESDISWDRWYAEVRNLSDPLFVKAMGLRGSPSGSNSICLTVWPNHHVEVSLVRGGNADFDAATLEAYRSMDGNAVLQYPAGSHRQTVTVFVDCEFNGEAVSGINSQSCVGDREVVRNK